MQVHAAKALNGSENRCMIVQLSWSAGAALRNNLKTYHHGQIPKLEERDQKSSAKDRQGKETGEARKERLIRGAYCASDWNAAQLRAVRFCFSLPEVQAGRGQPFR